MMARAAKRTIAPFHRRGDARDGLRSMLPNTSNKHIAKIALRKDSCPNGPKNQKSSAVPARAIRFVASNSIKTKWPTRSITKVPRQRIANHQPNRWFAERPVVWRRVRQRSATWLIRPMTINVVATANSPSSNLAFLRHPTEKPTAITAVVSNNPRILNWNRCVDVLASIDLILAHIAKLHNRPTRRTERSIVPPGRHVLVVGGIRSIKTG